MLDSDLSFISDDLRASICAWREWLGGERRAAAHTLEAYQSDLEGFLGFPLPDYKGGRVTLGSLADVKLADFRAWLAHLAGESLQTSSRARALAGVRSFFKWLDRSGRLHNAAISLLRAPKTPKRLPRPVSETDAKDIVELAKNEPEEAWVGLRDQALFTLLYGAGLRISEALGLRWCDLAAKERLVVTGKGSKQRIVPLLPIVREMI
jgi:integrase/recombinase XerC